MKNIVTSSKLSGRAKAPASKSYLQRAIFAALLAEGESRLDNITWSDDALHALHCALSLGAEVRSVGDSLFIKGSRAPRVSAVYAGESGLTGRMLSAILSIYDQEMILDGAHGLRQRPFTPMEDCYRQLGKQYHMTDGSLPIRLSGPMELNDLKIDGSLSSQFISGLLIGLPAISFERKLCITNPTSRPYIDMTLHLLRDFGVEWSELEQEVFTLEKCDYRAAYHQVEGDWSGASFLIVAAAMAGGMEITGLSSSSAQADKALLELPGLSYSWEGEALHVPQQELKGFEFDATQCPDLFPPLVSLATYARTPSKISGLGRLKHKESDRGVVLQQEFGNLGAKIRLEGDVMHIDPSPLAAAEVHSHNDHRIAMSLALAGLKMQDELTIHGCECVSKSYPNFHEDFIALGANFKLID